MPLSSRQQQILRILWNNGPLSRWELHERTKLTPNGVGSLVEQLLKLGVVSECAPEPSGGGRPRIPVRIDPARRQVAAVAIGPRHVEAARLSLMGEKVGPTLHRAADDPRRIVSLARKLLEQVLDAQTLAVGVSITGIFDASTRQVLLSSATAGRSAVSLEDLYDQTNGVPMVLENDMHAMAAHWLLSHRAHQRQDVLLVGLDDGQLGAAMLIDGRPNRGCVVGASELGHTRFFVETEKCYCGSTGCLERICSSEFLYRQSQTPDGPTLAQRAASFDGADHAMDVMLRYLAMGIANVVNFMRPHRLVLASTLLEHPAFAQTLVSSIRGAMLTEMADRVAIDLWHQPVARSAEIAGWLALARLFYEGWAVTESE